MKPDPNPVPSRDALHNLADALGEDVVAAPPERLLAEAAEDHGDAHALAAAFDRVSARAARQSVARRMRGPHPRASRRRSGWRPGSRSWRRRRRSPSWWWRAISIGMCGRAALSDKIASASAIQDARSAADAPAARGPMTLSEKKSAAGGTPSSPPTGLSYAPSPAATEAPQARTADIGAPPRPPRRHSALRPTGRAPQNLRPTVRRPCSPARS